MKDCYYDDIAEDYDNKRRRPWTPFRNFLKKLVAAGYQFKGINIDLGCANGRHFSLFNQVSDRLIGIDNSIEFLTIAKEQLCSSEEIKDYDKKSVGLILADMIALPIRPSIIQAIFSVASLHHVEGKDNRKVVVNEIFRSLKNDGFLILTVWRKWQKKYKQHFMKDLLKRKASIEYALEQESEGLKEHGDKHVPWMVSKDNEVYHRFYHFFAAQEIKTLLKPCKILAFELRGGTTDRDNFFLLAQK